MYRSFLEPNLRNRRDQCNICRKRYKKRNEETEKINRGNGGSMIKGAIFDVDGTLLDSMGIWKDVGVRYLNSIGIEAEPDLGNILFTMSIQEGAQYVKEHYHLSQEIGRASCRERV